MVRNPQYYVYFSTYLPNTIIFSGFIFSLERDSFSAAHRKLSIRVLPSKEKDHSRIGSTLLRNLWKNVPQHSSCQWNNSIPSYGSWQHFMLWCNTFEGIFDTIHATTFDGIQYNASTLFDDIRCQATSYNMSCLCLMMLLLWLITLSFLLIASVCCKIVF